MVGMGIERRPAIQVRGLVKTYGGIQAVDGVELAVAQIALLLLAAAGTLCGVAFSSVPRSARSAPAVVTPVVLVLQFVSGVSVLHGAVPPWLQHVAEVFPLKWAAQGMRSVFLPDALVVEEASRSWQHGTTAIVLAAWSAAGLVLCLRTFRWHRER